MRKSLVSGLILLLPIVLTLLIVSFLINLFTNPFLIPTQNFLEKFDFFHHSFLFFQQETVIVIASKTLILFFLFGFILFVGLVGRFLFIHTFLSFGDYLLHKLPVFNKIYKAAKDIVHSLFSPSSKKFSQVVFVPFPNPGNLSIGLVTSENIRLGKTFEDSKKLISVFVPGTPNPSMGFMLLFRRDQLIFLNMRVEEAMKFVVSCGATLPSFEIIHPGETDERHFTAQGHILSSEGQ